MIVTVTANSTIDNTLFIPAFRKDGTMRATFSTISMGGKPTDASFVLGTLGIPNRALGFAAGINGQKMQALLHERGVMTDFIAVEGETRLNTLIVDQSDGTMSSITVSTLKVSDSHIDDLLERCGTAFAEASVLITGGTLPGGMRPSFYTTLVGMARSRGIPVVFDASEPYLSAGLEARPTYIKPNRDELSALVGRQIQTVEEAYDAGRAIYERTGTALIITLGADGALAILPDCAYRIPAISVSVVSPAGAGDCVLAGLAASIDAGVTIEEGLKLGIGAATATLLLPGTADVRPEDVERFRQQVQLLPYPD